MSSTSNRFVQHLKGFIEDQDSYSVQSYMVSSSNKGTIQQPLTNNQINTNEVAKKATETNAK